jgi:hypothetical protein
MSRLVATADDTAQRWRELTSAKGHRVAPEDRLLVAYDDTGMAPLVTLRNPDGTLELRGAKEIQAASKALKTAARLARKFDPPTSLIHWRETYE